MFLKLSFIRLSTLSDLFQTLQDDVIRLGVQVVKKFEAEDEEVDYAFDMSHKEMIDLCTEKSGFIMWLTDDTFDLDPKAILPNADDHNGRAYKGAAAIASAAKFLVEKVGDDKNPKILKKSDALGYGPKYFHEMGAVTMLTSEYDFLNTVWSSTLAVLDWRR
jgi:hypothetical protein